MTLSTRTYARPCAVYGEAGAPRRVVMLHGRDMCGADMAAFASALPGDTYYVAPDAPCGDGRTRAWWPTYSATFVKPYDLATHAPPGHREAHAHVVAVLDSLDAAHGPAPTVLLGFSQGGMLAMDVALHQRQRIHALALLSACRITWTLWQPCLPVLAGMPVFVSHGDADEEIAFAAGEALRDAALAGGAAVTWLPLAGGHGMPMLVWRKLRQWLLQR